MTFSILSKEIQELLEDVDDQENALEFIEEYGEEEFKFYYDDYLNQVSELGIEPVKAFIEVFSISDVGNASDSYQGSYSSGAEFAEQLGYDCGYISSDLPSWIEIDWQKTWDNALSYDYCEENGYIFSSNW